MPTYEPTARFTADLDRFTPQQRCRFHRVITRAFVPDLRAGHFRAGLRAKGVRRAPGVYELTWAGDDRATCQYGPELVRGAPHIVWRRIGTQDILTDS
ncbi:hypothetical protein [Streptomyces sp. IBSBF 2435]|uniref:hypothetical protein n=1 Tax=Streptomyces sp. IBSBF 2435 TaxID=2903531 RepID=UPI002FDC5CBC